MSDTRFLVVIGIVLIVTAVFWIVVGVLVLNYLMTPAVKPSSPPARLPL